MLNLIEGKSGNIHFQAYLSLFLASIIYGGNTVAGRLIAGAIPPLTVSAIRVVLALIILLPAAWPAMKTAQKPSAREILDLILLSFLSVTIPYNSLLLGLKYTTGTNASIIFATVPACTILLVFLIYKVKPSKYQTLGMVTAFFGLMVVFTQGHIANLFTYQLGRGEFFICINVLSVCLSNILGQKIMKKLPSVVTSIYAMFFAAITLIPLGAWQSRSFDWSVSWTDWLVVLYMGFLAAGIAYFLNLHGVDKIGSGPASIFSNLNPVFGIVFSVLILKETLALYHLLGFFLVISGIVFALARTPSLKRQQPLREGSGQSI